MLLRTLLLALTLLAFAPFLHAAAIDVYLLAGQSNMDGRGKTAELDAALKEPLKDVPIWYRQPLGDSGGFQPLAPGFSIPPGHKGGLPGPTFGIELSFARALLAKEPKQRIAFIKGSRGGTTAPANRANPTPRASATACTSTPSPRASQH